VSSRPTEARKAYRVGEALRYRGNACAEPQAPLAQRAASSPPLSSAARCAAEAEACWTVAASSALSTYRWARWPLVAGSVVAFAQCLSNVVEDRRGHPPQAPNPSVTEGRHIPRATYPHLASAERTVTQTETRSDDSSRVSRLKQPEIAQFPLRHSSAHDGPAGHQGTRRVGRTTTVISHAEAVASSA
jgi:hypothetical protein